MTDKQLLVLEARIKLELQNLDRLKQEFKAHIELFGPKASSFQLRAVGSLLHDFYTAAERLWEIIARAVDGSLPSGDEWHKELLQQMSLAIPGLRPRVIDEKLRSTLSEYLRFRHVFRNVYGFELEWNKMKALVDDFLATAGALEAALRGFLSDLKEIARQASSAGPNQ